MTMTGKVRYKVGRLITAYLDKLAMNKSEKALCVKDCSMDNKSGRPMTA